MASTSKLINIILRVQNDMKGLDSAANSLRNLSSNLTSMGQKMTAGITLPLVGAGAAMFKTFADFESVMAELEARTGSTAEEMKKMEAFAIEMGAKTAFSAQEAAQALLELTSSGSSASEAMSMLPSVLDLAAAGALELGESADAVTDILAQFGVSIDWTEDVVDSLAQAAGASSATVSDLVQAFANAGPVMSQFGLSINESAAALAVLAENGVKGAEAGTMLKSMLMNMGRNTAEAKAAWLDLGLSMYDAQGNMRDIDDIFKDINKAMEGMSMKEQNEIAQALAGTYGIVGFNALRASNGISDMQTAMAGAANAEAVAAARMNTLAGRFDQLMGSVETLGIVLGGLAEGPASAFLEWLTGVVNGFTAWAQANPAMAQTLMIILAIVAAIGPLLVIVGQLLGAFTAIQTFMVAFPAIAAAFSGALAILLSPIALVVAALVLLALAIFNNWFGIRDIVWNAVKGIVDAIYWMIGQIQSAAPAIADFMMKFAQGWAKAPEIAWTALSQIGQIIWQRLSVLGSQMMTLGQAIINGLINGIKSKAVDLIAYVFGLSKEMTAAIKRALGIASPSKVMMKLGEQTAAGFHKGIEGFGGIGVNVNGRPVNGSAPTLSAAGAGGGRGGGNIYIENLIMPPGTTKQQVDAFNKEVARQAKIRGAKK